MTIVTAWTCAMTLIPSISPDTDALAIACFSEKLAANFKTLSPMLYSLLLWRGELIINDLLVLFIIWEGKRTTIFLFDSTIGIVRISFSLLFTCCTTWDQNGHNFPLCLRRMNRKQATDKKILFRDYILLCFYANFDENSGCLRNASRW